MRRTLAGLPRSLTVTDTANALMQNRINISIIFNYLRDRGIAYRAQIARDLGISAPAVSRAIERLLKDEYVIESERVQVGTGKKAAQVSVNSGRGYIVGVDTLADPIKIAISDFAGILQQQSIAAPFDGSSAFSDHLIASIRSAIADFSKEAPEALVNLLAIGIGVPAVVDPQTGAILNASLYESLSTTNLPESLRLAFDVPIYIENISNLASIGEWKRGTGRDTRNMVFIEIGNGIGAGIILDGSLHRGPQGTAGEIGYFITEPSGLGFDSSRGGYLERRASLSAFGSAGQGPAGPVPAGKVPGLAGFSSATALFEAAGKGDAEAISIIAKAVGHLALATVNLMILLNPELVVIGGTASEIPGAEGLMLRPLIEEVERSYPFPPATIKLSSLGSKASLFGAVQFALDSLVVHAYPYRL
ncbi:MAG: ROK family protein [Spirochaetota bacterium]